VAHHDITVPEGATVACIGDLLERRGILSAREFSHFCLDNKEISIDGSIPLSLEGFLYPDTYQLPYRLNAEVVARAMTARFEEVIIPLYQASPEGKKNGLSTVVVIASLVEREARLDRERPVIAAVYYNRLKRGMPLQCDATIQYILGATKPVLGYEDLKIPSPYNTYLHPGLPPGPIGNPGAPSIRAALQPGKDRYLYYVADEKKGDGSHIFSYTYEEHKKAIRDYQE
jgi:UPF0755 protein